MLKYYFEIIKPGIIIGNMISIIGSFLFASHRIFFDFFLFFYTILGASLVIASACVFNNLIDCDIDKKMKRTSDRVLSKKILSPVYVYIFAIVLGMLGFFILGFLVNFFTMFVSIFGFFVYVFLYTLLSKRKTIHSTFIGSFSGSTPSIIGYTAVTDTIDIYALLLFIIFLFWQMAHFYAIAIFRIEDYEEANIPVFSVVKGVNATKKYIFYYIFLFVFFSFSLAFLANLSYVFLFFSSMLNIYWLFISYCNIFNNNNKKNSRELFYISIAVIFLFNILLSADIFFNVFEFLYIFINILQVLECLRFC